MTQIRRATEADAEVAINTLRRSISELCFADHDGDVQEIKAWLRNKTVAAWNDWIAREDVLVLVADRNQTVVGVGMVSLQGKIMLNYVHPDARFSGVSKAMVAAMEEELRSRKVPCCQLESTTTAREFYVNCGFQREEANALIMSKTL
ncbi:MAG: GNAT family N-acetyltransferase [Amylibacter sp.]|nr:GNAT family N-acetyltransferase [Amylibacter sp.]